MELKYTGCVHSLRIPPHRVILSGCLLSFSDYTAAHYRYTPGNSEHPVIDYRVTVTLCGGVIKEKGKRSSSSERSTHVPSGLTKMLRRFSMDAVAGGGGGSGLNLVNKAHKPRSIEENDVDEEMEEEDKKKKAAIEI